MGTDLLDLVTRAVPETIATGSLFVMVVMLLRWQAKASTRHGEEMKAQRAENDRIRAQRDAAEERLRELYGLPPRLDPPTDPGLPPRRRRAR